MGRAIFSSPRFTLSGLPGESPGGRSVSISGRPSQKTLNRPGSELYHNLFFSARSTLERGELRTLHPIKTWRLRDGDLPLSRRRAEIVLFDLVQQGLVADLQVVCGDFAVPSRNFQRLGDRRGLSSPL